MSYVNRAVCRESIKEGVCPKLTRTNQYAGCSEDCQTDAECSGEQVRPECTLLINLFTHGISIQKTEEYRQTYFMYMCNFLKIFALN